MKKINVTCDVKDRVNYKELKPFQGKLKELNKENFEKIKKSIIEEGFFMPIGVWQNDSGLNILDGHQRVLVLEWLENNGYEIPEIPIFRIFADSFKNARKKLLHMVSQYGKVTGEGLYEFAIESEMNFDDLKNFSIPDMNLKSFGKEYFEDNTVAGLCDEDEVPEHVEPKTKLGDIYKLGNHRLMCGDSTSIDAVEKLMDGEKADIIFTSPPYSDMRDYEGGKDLSVDNLVNFIPTFFGFTNNMIINLGIQRKNGEINQYWNEYISKANSIGLKLVSWNVWNRSGMGGSIGNMTAVFPIEHEFIFVFSDGSIQVSKTRENKHGGTKQSPTNRQKDGSTIGRDNVEIGQYGKIGTVTTCDFERSNKSHPAPFPVELAETYISACSYNSVIDPFGGSGTTLIACEKTNRKCFMMELDPHYVSIIIERWCKFTGKEAYLLNENGTQTAWSEIKVVV